MPVICPIDIPRLTSEQFGRLDFRVMPVAFAVHNEMGVYELKTVASIKDTHVGQVLNYLRLLNGTRAKIINLRNHRVEGKFINCCDSLHQRRVFEVDSIEYRGPRSLCDAAHMMLRDLGTKLSNSLYTECLVANIGRTEVRQVWKDRNVFQKFNLVADDEAFVVTSMDSEQHYYRTHLSRMRRTAQLKRFHWINVTSDIVKFESVE